MTSGRGTTRAKPGSLKARLALADRMTSLGMIAAGAAHEFAPPLAAVIANLEHLHRSLERLTRDGALGAEQRELLLDASAAAMDATAGARAAASMVRDLKAFSRPAEEKHASFDVRASVERALRLVGPDLRRRARVTTAFGDAPPVLGSESLLTQVVVDLLVNAGQAMADPPGPESVIAVTVSGGDDEAVIEVHDTGVGIPQALLPRIFEPFFTTKPPEVGTGLGLWICRQIVAAHDGRIRVDSAPGAGTRIEIRLPAHRKPPAVRNAPEATSPDLPRPEP